MNSIIEGVDRQKLLDSCPCGCSCEFQDIFEYIDAHDADEDIIAKYLGFYVNQKWLDICKQEKFEALTNEGPEYKQKTVEALRAMADKIESGEYALILGSDLPELPIFSGEDEYISHIKVSIAKHYMGG